MFKVFEKYPEVLAEISSKKDGSMKLLENTPPDHPNWENRKKYLEEIDISPAELVSAQIIHGNEVAIVSQRDAGRIVESADGLVSREPGLFLSITTADCLPFFLYEPKQNIIGAIHAGWRSLTSDILTNAVGNIKKLGGAPENIFVGIGPAICQEHYEVGHEVAAKFAKYRVAVKRAGDKFFVDLKKIAQLRLLELGISDNNIEISPDCTFELPKKYFSARREKKAETEAMIAVIGLKK